MLSALSAPSSSVSNGRRASSSTFARRFSIPRLAARRRPTTRRNATIDGDPTTTRTTRYERDAERILRCCDLARRSEGVTAPHTLSGVVLEDARGEVVVEAFQLGQGGTRAEIACEAAVRRLGGVDVFEGGLTAYTNLEPTHGTVAGETRSVEALKQAGVRRVVVGMLHPIPGLRGRGVRALRDFGIEVKVLDADADGVEGRAAQECRTVNEAVLYRVATSLPFSVYKYAMTLDGKIATSTGHSSWVTGTEARERVFRERKRSDAVVVGGETVRKDDPRLTCREERGFQPARVVLSRSLNLPDDAKLWDVSAAPTIVLTNKGVRSDFQKMLRSKGVEVVEFDELTPLAASQYMYARGFLRCFWECGGGLAAPAMKSGVFHNIMAFIAPKLIGGGSSAPTPLGDLGLQAMHDALPLSGVQVETCGRDILMRGYAPNSQSTGRLGQITTVGYSVRGLDFDVGESSDDDERADDGTLIAVELAAASLVNHDEVCGMDELPPIKFFKAWDEYGALSNFSPFPIEIDGFVWPTVEHYYQAEKFAGVDSEIAKKAIEGIKRADSPEAAAKIGRTTQAKHPESVRCDWEEAKLSVMRRGLKEKFATHEGPRRLLMASVCNDGRARLIEDSPVDMIWGAGRDGTGKNLLGMMLSNIREELLQQQQQ